MSITVKLQNEPDLDQISVKKGTKLIDLLKDLKTIEERSVVAAFVDNKMRELNAVIERPSTVRFVRLNSLDGIRIYQRSASFILIKAIGDLFPTSKIQILHPIANGLYCELADAPLLTPSLLKSVEVKMQEIVEQNIPFNREEVPISKAIDIFKNSGREDKARLLSFRNVETASIYRLGEQLNYFYGYLAPSTGYIRNFSIVPYDNGFILHLPSMAHPTTLVPAKKSKKLYDVFKETLRWRHILEVEDVGMLNEVISQKRFTEFVLIAEAFHEKKIAQIADSIAERSNTKVVLLSGPSASGKTTFTKRLAIQLRINGFKPLLVSMDDYFLDREKTPKDVQGEHDFESPHALNIDLFKQQMQEVIKGNAIELPKYDFKTGTSGMSDRKISPTEQSVIIIEGIHGLNPILTADLPKESIFKIYVSPLTEIPLDSHNRIPTTDTRLLRRIIRDFQFRNYSAGDTVLRWPSVREGESKHVFPHQEEADIFFNTALIYELAALKTMAEPVLAQVTDQSVAYAEALRLLKFLSYILPIPIEVVPRHSILREFIGGSSFKY